MRFPVFVILVTIHVVLQVAQSVFPVEFAFGFGSVVTVRELQTRSAAVGLMGHAATLQLQFDVLAAVLGVLMLPEGLLDQRLVLRLVGLGRAA